MKLNFTDKLHVQPCSLRTGRHDMVLASIMSLSICLSEEKCGRHLPSYFELQLVEVFPQS